MADSDILDKIFENLSQMLIGKTLGYGFGHTHR